MKDINNLKEFDKWKIQLTIAINFISSKDNDEERVMHSKRVNIEIRSHDKADEAFEELFASLLFRDQIGLETLMTGKDFIFDFVNLLYCKCHNINLNRGKPNIDSPDWIKYKKAKINPINKNDDKCFPYAVTIALGHEVIKKDPQRTSIVCRGIKTPAHLLKPPILVTHPFLDFFFHLNRCLIKVKTKTLQGYFSQFCSHRQLLFIALYFQVIKINS